MVWIWIIIGVLGMVGVGITSEWKDMLRELRARQAQFRGEFSRRTTMKKKPRWLLIKQKITSWRNSILNHLPLWDRATGLRKF